MGTQADSTIYDLNVVETMAWEIMFIMLSNRHHQFEKWATDFCWAKHFELPIISSHEQISQQERVFETMKHISKSQVFYISSWVGYIMNPKCSISKVKLVKLAINKYIYISLNIIPHYSIVLNKATTTTAQVISSGWPRRPCEIEIDNYIPVANGGLTIKNDGLTIQTWCCNIVQDGLILLII